jgi:hypothetical protein
MKEFSLIALLSSARWGCSPSSPKDAVESCHLGSGKHPSPDNRICQYLNHGLPSLQNYEQWISVLYLWPSLRQFVIATPMDLDTPITTFIQHCHGAGLCSALLWLISFNAHNITIEEALLFFVEEETKYSQRKVVCATISCSLKEPGMMLELSTPDFKVFVPSSLHHCFPTVSPQRTETKVHPLFQRWGGFRFIYIHFAMTRKNNAAWKIFWQVQSQLHWFRRQ